TRTQLMHLLRMSPTLSDVVGSDPSLLANLEYVSRTNPELARFLQNHPEVVRNPDFYLFADLPNTGGRRSERLFRRTWDEGRPRQEASPIVRELVQALAPMTAFIIFMGVLLWLTRAFLENRRWSRVFKMQSEVHARLIERFGNNQELLTYMGTDAGKRFLEAAPIPVEFERDQRVPAALSRVLIPLQAGLVLTLLGIGVLALRVSLPEIATGLLVFGTVILMPGLGFILSAGITWLLASRFGLMQRTAPHTHDANSGASL
ncbi:MAG TPA: hypothetical protein VNU92_08960, partial [Edaphobacter sp.]|nr:hypothetical protein [Edaphobacter sp.]